MQAVVITGASTGIGLACAQDLASRGLRVFAGVRRDADADRLTDMLGARVTPVRMDVTDAASLAQAVQDVRAALDGATLAGLVCNAGVAEPGPLLHLPLETFQRQLDVNVSGVLRTVQAFAPVLGAERAHAGPPGRVVTMSSVSGLHGYPFAGAYAASKHALEGLSESLRRELMVYGIDVIVIGPGSVKTPIWDKAAAIDPAAYAETDYAQPLAKAREAMLAGARAGLEPEQVARTVARALLARRPRVRYAVARPSLANAFLRLAPKRLADALIARALGLTPRR